jgi:hypothetical protein
MALSGSAASACKIVVSSVDVKEESAIPISAGKSMLLK